MFINDSRLYFYNRMDQVKIDFSNPEAEAQKIREDLKAIIKQHDDSIIESVAK